MKASRKLKQDSHMAQVSWACAQSTLYPTTQILIHAPSLLLHLQPQGNAISLANRQQTVKTWYLCRIKFCLLRFLGKYMDLEVLD